MSSKSAILKTITSQLVGAVMLLALASAFAVYAGIDSLDRYARMTDNMQSVNLRVVIAERMNGLVNAVVMETRGLYMSRDSQDSERFARPLLQNLNDIGLLMEEWRGLLDDEDRDLFVKVEAQLATFTRFRNETVRLARESSPASAAQYGNNETNRENRRALNQSLKAIVEINDLRSRAIDARLDQLQENSVRTQTIGGVIVIATGLGLALLILYFRVSRPLRQLSGAMNRLARAERVDAVPQSLRPDEVGDMARSVVVFRDNAIARERLESAAAAGEAARTARQARIERLIAAFDSRLDGVLDAVGEGAKAMEVTARNLNGTALAATRQTDQARSASGAAFENVQHVATAAEELSRSIAEISDLLRHAKTVVASATSDAQAASERVSNLASAASRIGLIVDLIRDIAAQTNLLALNATIEAARAGDAGRSFAVVAAEVKSLASKTSQATDDIAAQIAAFEIETGGAVASIESIATTMIDVLQHTVAIAASTEQQKAATSEIARNAQATAEGTTMVSNSMETIATASGETVLSANDVLRTAEALAREAAMLRGAVETFFQDVQAA